MALPVRVADARLHALQLLEHGPALNEPVVSGASDTVNLLLGSVFFVWSLLQQSDMQHSIHFAGIVCLLFVAFAVIGWLQRHITAAVAGGGLRDVSVERYTLGLVAIASGYLGGLLVRLIVDPLTNGPRVAPFDLGELLLPFATIVCLTSLFAQLRVVPESYARIRAAIRLPS